MCWVLMGSEEWDTKMTWALTFKKNCSLAGEIVINERNNTVYFGNSEWFGLNTECVIGNGRRRAWKCGVVLNCKRYECQTQEFRLCPLGITSWMWGVRIGDDDSEGSCSWLMMPKRHTGKGSPNPSFFNLCFLQACDPGLSRTCDQNVYLSGLCYLFDQNLKGPVLQSHPGYQGKELGI